MHPGPYWIAMAGAGLAGFDPTIALVGMAWVLAGSRTRTVLAFLLTALAGTWVLGVAASLLLGRLTDAESVLEQVRAGWYRAVLELMLVAVAAGWCVVRLVRGPRPARQRSARAGMLGAAGLGLALVAGWVLDPGFLAAVVIGGAGTPFEVAIGWALWVVVAQALTMLLVAATLTGAQRRLARRLSAAWERTGPYRFVALTVVIALVGAVLAADALTYVLRGRYLLG